jgi:hypothetical protein
MASGKYRKFYFEQVGKAYDSNFAIHHINFDRSDNRIDNLVALPKKLHSRYHFLKRIKDGEKYELDFVGGSYDVRESEELGKRIIHDYQAFYDTLRECAKWVDERDKLLGRCI